MPSSGTDRDPSGRLAALVQATDSVALFLLFLGMFFFSGASALVYEVVWTRLLALIFGVTLHAISAVLASFMGGMALGSFLVGRLADRVKRPLIFYGLMEIGIGVTAMASLYAIRLINPLYVQLYHASGDSEWFVSALRFMAACAVMLVPTALMGATLPFMVRASLLHLSKVGENISLLYALNTAGAATGALLAGWVLIGALGLQMTVRTGAIINVCVGLAALVIAALTWRMVDGPASATVSPATAEPSAQPGRADAPARRALLSRLTGALRGRAASASAVARGGRGASAAVLFGIGVSGFCALAYEVIWFRLLNLFLNGTTYAFTVMLVTFLIGLALGSAFTRLIIGWRWNWAMVLGILQFLIGAVALLGLEYLPKLPLLRDAVVAIPAFAPLLGRPVFTMAAACALALLPLAFLLGMTFPVAAQALAREPGKEGAHIGALNAANTLGAIGGSLLGGLIMVPLLGSQFSMTILASINLSLALLLVAVALWRRPALRFAAPAPALAVVWLISGRPGDIYPEMYGNLFKGHVLLWHEEGIENTVSVFRHPDGYKIMYLDSREQAFDHPAPVLYHELIGQLGMILQNQPKEALVVGLGGGATAGAISRFKDTHVDVVELSPAVAHAAAAEFAHVNNDVLNQPNVTLKLDDGRNYMMLTNKKYDLITADLIQAFHAGSGNLYSREYFTLAKGALKDGGLMVQWVNPGLTQLYPLIVRTFAEVFPGASAWYSGTLLVGSTRPVTADYIAQTLRTRLVEPGVQEAAVKDLNFTTPEQVITAYYNTIETVIAGMPPGPNLILTDDRPLTEYFRSVPGTEDLEKPGAGQ